MRSSGDSGVVCSGNQLASGHSFAVLDLKLLKMAIDGFQSQFIVPDSQVVTVAVARIRMVNISNTIKTGVAIVPSLCPQVNSVVSLQAVFTVKVVAYPINAERLGDSADLKRWIKSWFAHKISC